MEKNFSPITDSRTLQDYTKLDVGFTESGLQVWCRRHDTNVVHIDFEERNEQTFDALSLATGLADDIAATVIMAILPLLLKTKYHCFRENSSDCASWLSSNAIAFHAFLGRSGH